MNEDNISKAIDAICHQGCTSVASIIEALEKGKSIEQASHLSYSELIVLLRELKAIMAVYEKRS